MVYPRAQLRGGGKNMKEIYFSQMFGWGSWKRTTCASCFLTISEGVFLLAPHIFSEGSLEHFHIVKRKSGRKGKRKAHIFSWTWPHGFRPHGTSVMKQPLPKAATLHITPNSACPFNHPLVRDRKQRDRWLASFFSPELSKPTWWFAYY